MVFRLIYRIWKKNTASFILRLLGLTLSLSFIIVLLVFILHESSYDDHIKNKENIYRITTYNNLYSFTEAHTPFIPRSIILNNIPEIFDLARFENLPDIFINKGDDYIPEKKFRCADFEILKILNIQLADGDFLEPDFVYYVAISQKTARKYFPDGSATGKILCIRQEGKELSAVVTAVFEDIPETSTFQADIIGNHKILFYFKGEDYDKEPWEEISTKCWFYTYVTLQQGIDPHIVEGKMNGILYPPDKNFQDSVHFQPLKDIYLGSKELVNNDLINGSRSNIQLFIIICILLVLLTSSNLALITATFHYHRKPEYFVRMVHGASRSDILKQILGEILMILTLSVLVSIILTAVIQPLINSIFGKHMSLDSSAIVKLITLIAVVLSFIALTALSLSSVMIFRKKQGIDRQESMSHNYSSFRWNKLLVLGQIAVFSSLIVISAILLNQWKFLKSKDALGFDPKNLLVLELPGELNENCDVLINELTSNPQIINVSKTNYIPMLGPTVVRTLLLCLTDDYTKQTTLTSMNVGSGYFKTLGLELVEGREFDLTGDYDKENSIMLNEAAVKSLQFDEPLGKKVAFKEVIGIVKDFPVETLYDKIPPLYIFPADDYSTFILIKYQGDRSAVFNYIAEKQNKLVPVSELKLNDFPSIINKTYEYDRRLKSIFVLFTIIALLLGIFGIIGLLIFNLQRRSKEITIRIIHGASYYNIVSLISKEFLVTVLISNIITYPFIWYFANDWLSNFTSHIMITIWYFVSGTCFTILISLTLVFVFVLKQIRENPIRNLAAGQ